MNELARFRPRVAPTLPTTPSSTPHSNLTSIPFDFDRASVALFAQVHVSIRRETCHD